MPCRISGKIIGRISGGRISGQISIRYNPNRYLSYITFSHDGSSSEHGGMVLHGLLHFYPDLGGGGDVPGGEAECVKVGHGGLAGVGRQFWG